MVSRGIPCLPSPPSVRPGSDLEIVRSVAAAMEIFLPSRCDRNRNAATTREWGEGQGGREIQSFHLFNTDDSRSLLVGVDECHRKHDWMRWSR